MKTKGEYIENLAAELNGWKNQIQEFNVKAEKAVGITKLKYHQELTTLRALQNNADSKMKTMKAASADTWVAAREAGDKAVNELRSGMANSSTTFK